MATKDNYYELERTLEHYIDDGNMPDIYMNYLNSNIEENFQTFLTAYPEFDDSAFENYLIIVIGIIAKKIQALTNYQHNITHRLKSIMNNKRGIQNVTS